MKRKNRFNRKIVMALLFSMFCFTIFAQNITVSGTVVDDKNEPVIGASVVVVGHANLGTVTNFDGNYTLANVPKNATLRISYVGMQPQEIAVNGQTTINATLAEDSKALKEVVVTALGVQKQDRALGYATSNVKTSEIIQTNTINPINALQGKVAGVNINIIGTSGVTSSSSITIRGAKSIDKNNSPIFVIDGIVMENNIMDTYGGKDWGSQLKNLNPDDYQSITVLKGAAATSLYGSRGANGAIVIVTKSGYARRGVGVEFSQTLQGQYIYQPHMKLQNLYGAGTLFNGYEGEFNNEGKLDQETASFGPFMDGREVNQYYLDGKKTSYSPRPNNWKDLYQNGMYSNTNISITGGNEKAVYRLSYSFMNNKGNLKNNEFGRHSINFKTNGQINKVFGVELGLNYVNSKGRNAYDQGFWREDKNLGLMTIYNMPRNLDLKDFYNNYRDPNNNALKSQDVFGSIAKFLHRLDYYNEIRNEESLLANVTLKAQITSSIDASAKANYNMYNTSNKRTEYGAGPNFSGGGYYGTEGSRSGNYNLLFMLHGKKEFMNGDLEVDGRIANEIYGNTKSESWGKGTKDGLIVPGLFAFSNSVGPVIPWYKYTPSNYRVIGLSGILNFAWKNQLFLELTARNDWNSSLLYPKWITSGENNYSVFYPSANLSWVFTDTYREKMPEWFSFGKLRASIARVGMGTAAYGTADGAGGFSAPSDPVYDQNGNVIKVYKPNINTLPNLNLKPEIQQSIEAGADLRFINDRFGIDFAYYKTNTYNQILSIPNVLESGFPNKKINAGNIQNQGIEIMLDLDPIRNKDLRWNVQVNFSHNRGKIIKFQDDIKEWKLMGSADAGPEIWAYEGGDFGVITSMIGNNGWVSTPKLWNNEKDPNDPRNGKPIIFYVGERGDPNSVSVYRYVKDIDNKKTLGKVEADFFAGLNTSLYWKNFDFYTQLDTRVGGKFFSHSYKYGMGNGTLEESLIGRDGAHSGIPRVNYKGETINNGILLDAVFRDGTKVPSKTDPKKQEDVGGMTYKEAVDKNLINPMLASAYYLYNYGWGQTVEFPIMNNTWVALREITIGYKLPDAILSKIKLQYLRVAFSARNIGYLYNGLKGGLNPESIQSNNPLTPYEYGAVPYARNFAIALNVKF